MTGELGGKERRIVTDQFKKAGCMGRREGQGGAGTGGKDLLMHFSKMPHGLRTFRC